MDIIFLTFSLIVSISIITITTNAESVDSTIVKSNLKRIINNALDALVNLEEDTSVITARATEMTERASEMASNEAAADDENFLANEIKELENLLVEDKREVKKGRAVEAFFESVAGATAADNEKRDVDEGDAMKTSDTGSYKRELLFDDASNNAKRESKSREEKANVELDNSNLEDLLDFVVRAIDEEAKRSEVSAEEGDKDAAAKKEVTKQEEKDAGLSKKEIVASKEESNKNESVKKELCNARKKECVQKKSETTASKKESVQADNKAAGAEEKEIMKKSAAVANDSNNSNDVREMVEELLDGKSEEEREALATLLEDVFDRSSKGTKSANSVGKKNSAE